MTINLTAYAYCENISLDCECSERDFATGDHEGYFEASRGDSPHETIASYKIELKKAGWHFRGKLAYCPICWKALKGE